MIERVTEPRKPQPETAAELTRFEKLARALFGVKRQDVPKHEPKKRQPRQSDATRD